MYATACTKYFVILHNLNIIGPKNCHLQLVTTKKTKFGWKRTFLWTLTDTILLSSPLFGVCEVWRRANMKMLMSPLLTLPVSPWPGLHGKQMWARVWGVTSDQAGHITRVSTGELLLQLTNGTAWVMVLRHNVRSSPNFWCFLTVAPWNYILSKWPNSYCLFHVF